MNITHRKLVSSAIAFVCAFSLLFGVSSTTYANESSGHDSQQHNSGYGGNVQFGFIPSVDYAQSAFMQNFNYQNEVNFANRTTIAYATSQANESYSQGFNLSGRHSNDHGFGASFGVNALFMWLAGLFNGHGGHGLSFMH